MKMFSFIIFIFLIDFTSGINVGGVILENTIWTKTNNPYYVIEDVQIPFNVTLTIKEGVIIIYTYPGDFEMLIKGFLHVQGTNTERVIFNGSKLINDIKSMITFSATNLSRSSIVYAKFLGPKGSVRLTEVPSGIPLNTGEVIVQQCIFNNTQINADSSIFNPGVFVTPILTIKNSTITNSIVSNGNNAPQFIQLISNHIQNIIINSIAFYNGMRMSKCYGKNVSIYWRGYDNTYFEINNTNLTNVLISYHTLYSVETFFYIRRSIFHNATIRMIGQPYDGIINLDIISSKLTVSQPIQIQTGSIQCSTITSFGNKSNLTGIYAGSIFINNSSIFNFNIGLQIYSYSKPMSSISHSNFYDNSLYNIQNSGDSNINATNNWWGTTTHIGDKLYDYWKNINCGEIFYNNYAQKLIEEQC